MNIIDAARKTVKDYPGGSEALATRMVVITQEGREKPMSAAVLRSKVNPDVRTHHLYLTEASEIMDLTGDHRILHALAAEHGYVLQKADPVDDDGNVLQTLLRTNAAEGEFDRVLQEALADNLITPNELKQINDAAVKQQAATLMLLAKLRALAQTGRS